MIGVFTAAIPDIKASNNVVSHELEVATLTGTPRSSFKLNDFTNFMESILEESYKAHLYKIRNQKNAPAMAAYENSEYTESVYGVIFNGIVRPTLKINPENHSAVYGYRAVHGTRRLMTFFDKHYVSIDKYTAANFNYLVLMNTLDYIIHKGAEASAKTIDEVAKDLRETVTKGHDKDLQEAARDIKSYMKELQYKYKNNLKPANHAIRSSRLILKPYGIGRLNKLINDIPYIKCKFYDSKDAPKGMELQASYVVMDEEAQYCKTTYETPTGVKTNIGDKFIK
jgi:hypothetical protein